MVKQAPAGSPELVHKVRLSFDDRVAQSVGAAGANEQRHAIDSTIAFAS